MGKALHILQYMDVYTEGCFCMDDHIWDDHRFHDISLNIYNVGKSMNSVLYKDYKAGYNYVYKLCGVHRNIHICSHKQEILNLNMIP